MVLLRKNTILRRCTALVIAASLLCPPAYAQGIQLPPAGDKVALSSWAVPPLLKGLKVYPDNPFRFDFLLDKGHSKSSQGRLEIDAGRLIRYFMTTLTIPEKDLWVNLSPYEKDRIIPEALGVTEMGRDMLAQDYILKQVTASLMDPEGKTGKAFWDKVYAQAQRRYGTIDIPVDTFNKVWVMPDKAVVDEYNNMAFVVDSKLKVMVEEDYLALEKNATSSMTNKIGSDIVREVIIPVLTQEVNEGENFVLLRQVYHSLILAAWYKRKIKESMLDKVYVERNKIAGVDLVDKAQKEKIYAQYLEAFRKGVYNYIKEEYDAVKREIIPRKYFSGGESFTDDAMDPILVIKKVGASQVGADLPGDFSAIAVVVDPVSGAGDHSTKVLLANELSEEVFEKKWAEYIQKEGLGQYEKLLPLFTREVKESLLDDPALRPVFLQILPTHSMGEIVVLEENNNLIHQKIGQKTLMDYMEQYSSFLVSGDVAKTNNLASKDGIQLLVGVTDRPSDNTMYPLFQVANGRQVFFPLPDGTWLGVKGAGQFIDPKKLPHYPEEDKEHPVNSRHTGVASEKYAQRAMRGAPFFTESPREFVQFLGYRRINDLPDGNGNLVSVTELKNPSGGGDLNPVLVFNRTLTPQRLVKLPQLVQTDPGLQHLSRKLSRVLSGLGLLPIGTGLNAADLILMVMKNRGKAEALKQNKGWFKVTLHSQDMTLAGEEADNIEWVPYQDYIQLVLKGLATQDDDKELLIRSKLSTAGMFSTVYALSNMIRRLPYDQKSILFPSPSIALKVLFESYFSSLDENYLAIWAKRYGNSVRSLPTRLWDERMDFFHPSSDSVIFENMKFTGEVYSSILSLAQEEMSRRKKNIDRFGKTGNSDNKVDNGGIDFNTGKLNLLLEHIGGEIKFNINPVMLEQLQGAVGFNPVILDIQTIPGLSQFIGIGTEQIGK